MVLTFGFMTTPVLAEEEHTGEYSKEMLEIAEKVLLDLGLWQDFKSDEIYLTRAEAAVIVCLIQDVYEEYKNPDSFFEPRKNFYKDVPFEHWAFKYISMAMYNGNSQIKMYSSEGSWESPLIRFGPMYGDGNGNFRPDDFITYQEFAKVLVETLEWSLYAAVYQYSEIFPDSYPDAYWNMAKLLGLYPLKEEIRTKPVTKDDAIVLLYNTLKVPMMIQRGFHSPGYLFERCDWVKEYKDAVQIRGYAKIIDENTIVIDGTEYYGKVNDENFTEGLVLCYCIDKTNQIFSSDSYEDYKKIICCYPISSLDFDNPIGISDELPDKFKF